MRHKHPEPKLDPEDLRACSPGSNPGGGQRSYHERRRAAGVIHKDHVPADLRWSNGRPFADGPASHDLFNVGRVRKSFLRNKAHVSAPHLLSVEGKASCGSNTRSGNSSCWLHLSTFVL